MTINDDGALPPSWKSKCLSTPQLRNLKHCHSTPIAADDHPIMLLQLMIEVCFRVDRAS